ncbi:MAG: hypothetical protein EYC68_19670 [Chloroflexota bacterium]|nr:MAG: hypothetical protein EYC68_19670 [Chloroflexota bacterium]
MNLRQFFSHPPLRSIVLLWLAWLVILISFQTLVLQRFEIRRPDRVLEWTPGDTGRHDSAQEPSLTEPFLNTQVSMDSEYYLSIATVGYDDPLPGEMERPRGEPIKLNYAFFPAYPYLMRAVSIPLSIFGLNQIATATPAGVLVSALGALAAMVALYDLCRKELGDAGGLRAGFYLLIFPTGFFLAQLYTEGLFLGFSFVALALMRRKHLIWASILAVIAVYTRAIGVALVIPLAYAWFQQWRAGEQPRGRVLLNLAFVILPLAAYALWRFSAWGEMFTLLEENYFGRKLFWLDVTWQSLTNAWSIVLAGKFQTSLYYGLEFGAIGLGIAACVLTARRYPEIAFYSFIVLLIPLTSGYLQSNQRYVLAMPALFLALARLGKNVVFDRVWSLLSILWVGFLAMLFSFDFWTA